MPSDSLLTPRPPSEDPNADWAEHEFHCWSPRDEPWLTLATTVLCGVAVGLSWFTTRQVWMPILVTLGILGAGFRIWLPSAYRLGPLGIRQRLFRRWVLVPWERVIRVEFRTKGVLFETAPQETPPLPSQAFYVHGGIRVGELHELVRRFDPTVNPPLANPGQVAR